MSDLNMERFERRVHRLNTKRRRRDGLFVEQSRSGTPRRRRLMWPLVITIMVFSSFKGALQAELGAREYAARLEIMNSGSTGDQAMAILMSEDPLSGAIARHLSDLLCCS